MAERELEQTIAALIFILADLKKTNNQEKRAELEKKAKSTALSLTLVRGGHDSDDAKE